MNLLMVIQLGNISQLSITDNIGNFENIIFKFNISKDTTDDIFNPSNGHYNNLNLIFSPLKFQMIHILKLFIQIKIILILKNSKNFIFFNNNFGYAESLKSKLKTINALV
jgi:outer membrane protein assembly factor BamA